MARCFRLRLVVLVLPAVALPANAGAPVPPDFPFEVAMNSGARAANAQDYRTAEEQFLKAVALAGKFPPRDTRIGSALNTLGLVYREDRKYADAEKAFQRALEVFVKNFGADSLDAGNVEFNIATALQADGHYEESLAYIRKSQAIYQQTLGPGSLKMASTLCMEGVAYRNTRRPDDAIVALKRCADMHEAAGGMESSELGDALYNLGLVYSGQGRADLAEPVLKISTKIRELALGITSPQLAEALEAHASALRQLGRAGEAAKDEAMAAAIRGKKSSALTAMGFLVGWSGESDAA